MMDDIQPCIIFHTVEDKNSIIKNFNVELEFYGNGALNLNKRFIIDDKLFSKIKDKFKTKTILEGLITPYKMKKFFEKNR